MTSLAIIGAMLVAGGVCGAIDRRNVRWGWLMVAAGLYLVNDALLTSIYGLVPNVFAGSDWNWQGKLLALAATLAIATHPAFGFARSGLTLRQNKVGRPLTYAVAIAMLALFTLPALPFDPGTSDPDALAFQLTMPGFEEEPFYRGIFLLALNEAFRGRWQALGIEWGWGGLISCFVFGLVHALDFENGAFAFDVTSFAFTGLPALLLLWFRERTGSLVLPIILHNYANAIGHLI